MKAYEEAIRATATKHAPWYVVPGRQQVVHAARRRRGDRRGDGPRSSLDYPESDAAQRKELAAARAALAANEP